MSFDGGMFQHTYEEPALGGTPNPAFVFKFEADGYAPFVTRRFRPLNVTFTSMSL